MFNSEIKAAARTFYREKVYAFINLSGLSLAIACSLIAYYSMDEWLTGFAYRAGINPLVFIISAAIVMAVAFITIALQSYRTATANPADMMHYE